MLCIHTIVSRTPFSTANPSLTVLASSLPQEDVEHLGLSHNQSRLASLQISDRLAWLLSLFRIELIRVQGRRCYETRSWHP